MEMLQDNDARSMDGPSIKRMPVESNQVGKSPSCAWR